MAVPTRLSSLPSLPSLSSVLRSRRSRLAAGAAVALALASPLLVSSVPAGAATTATWNRLAGCESGGNWHINTGNGYYGGLQFSQSTWVAMGGTKYAARADLASPQQQMDIGNALLKANDWSWRAWPACSSRLGLTRAEAMAMDPTVEGKFEHVHLYVPDRKVPHAKPQGRLDSK